jgi:DNA polymerase elongation subunit (family B)
VISKGYENCLLLVTKAIDKIMTGEEIQQQDLIISKLLRQDIEKYKSLFPHVSAAIQLSSKGGVDNHPRKGDTIQYIYTNSQRRNPLCRVVPLEILQKVGEKDGKQNSKTLNYYDKDKYREMILDATETVLKFLGLYTTVYENPRNNRKKKMKWYYELHEERTKDIQAEGMMEKQ